MLFLTLRMFFLCLSFILGMWRWLLFVKQNLLVTHYRYLIFILISQDFVTYKSMLLLKYSRRNVALTLLVLASSYTTLVFHTRSFSNTTESLILSLCFYFMIEGDQRNGLRDERSYDNDDAFKNNMTTAACRLKSFMNSQFQTVNFMEIVFLIIFVSYICQAALLTYSNICQGSHFSILDVYLYWVSLPELRSFYMHFLWAL
jgi:hypothetical protein